MSAYPTTNPFEKCGFSISPSCFGTTIPMNEAGWQTAANEITNTVGFLIQGIMMTMGTGLSFNLLQALNCVRCAFLSLGTNLW